MIDNQPSVEDVSPAHVVADGVDDTEVSLVDVLVAIGEQKYLLLRFVLVAAVLGLLLSFVLPPVYEAKTVIMPPEQAKPSLAASLAGLGSMAGIGDALGVKTPEEMYVGLLQSDSVANGLIDRFKLSERYRIKLRSETRLLLSKKTRISSDKKTGFISVAVWDKSPTFSAELANAYFDELKKLLDRLAVTDAQQRRVFFQQEIDRTLTRLSSAQSAFVQAQKKAGVVSLDEQVSSSIRASADLKARIEMLQVQLQSMRTYATEENPEVQRVLAEIQAMRNQLATLEQGSEGASVEEPSGDSSAIANIRAYREVKYQEALLDQFRKQLELAKMDEAREGPLVQQVDAAVPPDRRSWPRRSFVIFVASVLGLLIGGGVVLFRALLKHDGAFVRDFRRVGRAWRLRKRLA